MDPSFSLTRTIHKARAASRQQEPNITSVERVARNSGHCRLVGSINFKNRGSPAHFPTISSFGVASLCVFPGFAQFNPPLLCTMLRCGKRPSFSDSPCLHARSLKEPPTSSHVLGLHLLVCLGLDATLRTPSILVVDGVVISEAPSTCYQQSRRNFHKRSCHRGVLRTCRRAEFMHRVIEALLTLFASSRNAQLLHRFRATRKPTYP